MSMEAEASFFRTAPTRLCAIPVRLARACAVEGSVASRASTTSTTFSFPNRPADRRRASGSMVDTSSSVTRIAHRDIGKECGLRHSLGVSRDKSFEMWYRSDRHTWYISLVVRSFGR